MAKPISIAVRDVKVIKETDENPSDEPYVLTCVVDLSNKKALDNGERITLPAVATTKTGVWAGADTGETMGTLFIPAGLPQHKWRYPFVPGVARVPCWDFGGRPKVINHPDDIIILVAMMEHDDTDTETIRSIVNSTIVASANGLANDQTLTHDAFASRLRLDMEAAIRTANLTQPFNSDERLGPVQELRLTRSDLTRAEAGSHTMSLDFKGDGGIYRVNFELRNKSFLL